MKKEITDLEWLKYYRLKEEMDNAFGHGYFDRMMSLPFDIERVKKYLIPDKE